MPQLDKFSFIPQIGWLLIIFLVMYAVIFKFIVPQLAAVLKTRSILLAQLKKGVVSVGNTQLLLEKNYLDKVSYYLIQLNYVIMHLRYLLDSHYKNVNTFIKNHVHF